MPDDPDFPATIFTEGTATEGVPEFAEIQIPGDVDWFEVTLIDGRTYEIEVLGAATDNGFLRDPLFVGVYDITGNFLGSRDDNSGFGLNSLASFTAEYSGVHYFAAAAASDFSDDTGTYDLLYTDLGPEQPDVDEVLNEGDDITVSAATFIPSSIPPFSGSPDQFISARDITVEVISDNAIEDEDFTVDYNFGQTQTLEFVALEDDLVEDDETVLVRVSGSVDWIVPTNSDNGRSLTNLLGDSVFGFSETTRVDFSLEVTINSAPEGDPLPIEGYSFSGPEIIGNVLTEFEDGSLETFSAVPFTFSGGVLTGELLANGDLSITDATGTPGQNVIVRFDVTDERGAVTSSEQLITFGALQDDFLPGDGALALGSIAVDTPELGSIEIAEDRDRFQVSLDAGQLYSISLESATSLAGTLADPAIFGIYDSLNALVPGTADNDSGSGRNALLDQVVVDASGVYEIEVGSNTSFGTGGYELTVTSLGTADDFLPGLFASDFGAALVDVPVTGIIERDADRDRFEVTLQAGVQYTISLEGIETGGGSLVNPEIVGVYSSSGQIIPGSSDNNSGVGANALVSGLVVETDGTYQVEVASAQNVNVGDYTLTIESAGFVDDFLPGLSGGFGSVPVGGRASGEIETTGDVDGFRVTLQANTTYEISILGSESNTGTLLDPDLLGVFSTSDLSGTPISSVQTLNTQFVGDDSISYFTPQSPGEYFIGVQDTFGGVGTYAVAVSDIGIRDDFSADTETSGSIAPGGSATGRIDFAQDNDWFEVNLAAGRLYEIELVPTDGGNALADPFFRGVFDSDGVLIENTANDDGGAGTSSALQFVTEQAGPYYLSAGGFGASTGQYRLALTDLGPLDDDGFDITVEFTSDGVSDAYIEAFEAAVERWEDIITGDLPYAFVEGYGFVDDILIEVAVEDLELSFEGVDQTILAISSVLDQRSDTPTGSGALPTYSRIVINSEEVGALLNLDEFVANTIGRALGFGSLWEEFGLVREIGAVATYTGSNALREIEALSDDLNGVNVLEDGGDGALAAEYWSEAVLNSELMTPRVELRRQDDGPGNPNVPDNPISELTIAAMQDLGYQVDYGEADNFRLSPGALSRQADADRGGSTQQSTASKRLLSDLPNNDEIPNGAALIYTRPNVLSEQPSGFALNNANSELVDASGTNAVFLEGVTGENFIVELKGTFEKNNPTTVNSLDGTVASMEVRSLTGLLLFSVDYSQQPVPVAEVVSQWPNYSMDDENVIVVDTTVPGTVARINPNGGGENASRIFAGASDDYVRGGAAAEFINGGADNDSLLGEAGNDTLIGEGGNDRLEGGRGADVVNGGAGLDTGIYSGAQASYTLTLSPTETRLADRRSDGNGDDRLINIELLDFDTDFGDGAFDLRIFGGPTSLTEEAFESFIELYIAYFNRAPDAVGLNFWGTSFANGVSLDEMAALFVGQDETRATYPEGTATNDFVTSVYQNVLGRTPDGEGFDFWVDALTSGGVTRDFFILDALRGAKSELKPERGQAFVDQQLADRAYLADKTDIGAYFAVHKGMSDVENASAVMALFDGSQSSINAAVAATDGHYADALNPTTGEFLMPVIGVLDDPFSA